MKSMFYILEKLFKYEILDSTKVKTNISNKNNTSLNDIYHGIFSKRKKRKYKKVDVLKDLNKYHFEKTNGEVNYDRDLKDILKNHKEKIYREMEFKGVALKPAKID